MWYIMMRTLQDLNIEGKEDSEIAQMFLSALESVGETEGVSSKEVFHLLKYHQIGDKAIADTVEALVGEYLPLTQSMGSCVSHLLKKKMSHL